MVFNLRSQGLQRCPTLGRVHSKAGRVNEPSRILLLETLHWHISMKYQERQCVHCVVVDWEESWHWFSLMLVNFLVVYFRLERISNQRLFATYRNDVGHCVLIRPLECRARVQETPCEAQCSSSAKSGHFIVSSGHGRTVRPGQVTYKTWQTCRNQFQVCWYWLVLAGFPRFCRSKTWPPCGPAANSAAL